jgi:hypothetical protein
MKYQIFYLKQGRLSFGKHTIFPADSYKDEMDIPLFDEENTPITEGLRLLEKSGVVEIRPFRKNVHDNQAQPEFDDEDHLQGDDGGTTLEDEEEEIIETPEQIQYDKEQLESMNVKELNDICKELGLSGYSSLKKEEKIALILGE